jgi:DNA-binding MarR family transcriptional regulator
MAKTSQADPPVREWPAIRALRAIWRAQASITEKHRRFLAEHHALTVSEFDMIAELGNTEGLRMGALARKMITSPANVTRLATRLEKRGLVQRTRAPDSDREVVASLTAKGQAFFDAHFREVVGFSKEVMEAKLGPDELETLAELCQRLQEG